MPSSEPSSPTKTVHHDAYKGIDPARSKLSARNKRVFITGGGSAIGRAITKAFATAKATEIAITGRTEAALLETKQLVEAESEGVTITPIVADITDQKAIEDAFLSFGTVDILVNNAGFMPDLCPIKDSGLDEWWRGFEINVRGTFIVTQAFLKVASPCAALVNITAGLVHMNDPLPGYSSYVSSKAASAKFFQMLQHEHPALRVMNVHPGVIQSAMLEKNAQMVAQDDSSLPASFIVWACSPEADFLKGKFVWANWDAEELKAREEEIRETDFLTLGLNGWPSETALTKGEQSSSKRILAKIKRFLCL
ncbi:MAG: hypothetical protein L6R38_000102 [Xanthoria sp. 2 TBL-2021]|nr:MAG: hypothetical protein L6R38_000102 [Xanthoria sp. 2 TBL-2021]